MMLDNKLLAAQFKGNPRPKRKTNRSMIDNEYFDWGYQQIFPKATFLVYYALVRRADNEYQTSYPSYETIMADMGIKSRTQINTALNQLEKYKIIEIIHSKGNKSNKYILLAPEAWIKPNRITDGTVTKSTSMPITVPKQVAKPYQNNTPNSTTDDTGTKPTNLTNEPENMLADKSKQMQATAVYKLLIEYYQSHDVEKAMLDLWEKDGKIPDRKKANAALKALVTAEKIIPIKLMNF